ncbi:hypothetical protein [Streptomyces sp. WAC 01325]|uniref:hypothetical protein n=1 Tax=Streptomyces sp. WAC 01325 TaxID=2203202 RepID=UPI000F87BBAE|nr:hypothetical protein [Streptomyces sp. WAC 01325]
MGSSPTSTTHSQGQPHRATLPAPGAVDAGARRPPDAVPAPATGYGQPGQFVTGRGFAAPTPLPGKGGGPADRPCVPSDCWEF